MMCPAMNPLAPVTSTGASVTLRPVMEPVPSAALAAEKNAGMPKTFPAGDGGRGSMSTRPVGRVESGPGRARQRGAWACVPPTMASTFISYRRDDAPGYAGRIYARFVQTLGRDVVFL